MLGTITVDCLFKVVMIQSSANAWLSYIVHNVIRETLRGGLQGFSIRNSAIDKIDR